MTCGTWMTPRLTAIYGSWNDAALFLDTRIATLKTRSASTHRHPAWWALVLHMPIEDVLASRCDGHPLPTSEAVATIQRMQAEVFRRSKAQNARDLRAGVIRDGNEAATFQVDCHELDELFKAAPPPEKRKTVEACNTSRLPTSACTHCGVADWTAAKATTIRNQTTYYAICRQCQSRTGAPHGWWTLSKAAALAIGIEVQTAETECNRRCSVRGCSEPGSDRHHWAPVGIFSRAVADDYGTVDLCLKHHALWHTTMNAWKRTSMMWGRIYLVEAWPLDGSPRIVLSTHSYSADADRQLQLLQSEYPTHRLAVAEQRVLAEHLSEAP